MNLLLRRMRKAVQFYISMTVLIPFIILHFIAEWRICTTSNLLNLAISCRARGALSRERYGIGHTEFKAGENTNTVI
jgi:hypothetical protein